MRADRSRQSTADSPGVTRLSICASAAYIAKPGLNEVVLLNPVRATDGFRGLMAEQLALGGLA